MNVARTASQTIGPFFHDCLLRPGAEGNTLTTERTPGERIRIQGHLHDGDGRAVPDAMIEIWQANTAGRYNHPGDESDVLIDPSFIGFGRTGTDAEGAYRFETIKPGATPFDERRMQAPHVNMAVFGRGLLNHLYTRLYFADEFTTAQDPMLQLVPAERRETLLAHRVADGTAVVYRFDIILQGARETVFFDF